MDFWTAADQQNRRNFTRADGVFAVADPDEWDDQGSPAEPGQFDSSLSSQPVDVSGRSTVFVNFASHYRQYDAQTAQVLVSFDQGEQVEILRYDGTNASDDGSLENRYLNLEVAVPDSATSMTVTWRLSNGGNDWYWAIDDVVVADEAIDRGPPPELPPPPPPFEVPEEGPEGISDRKVLTIGLDGVNYSDLMAEYTATPNLDSLIEQGVIRSSQYYSPPVAATSSGPGWSSIATGAWPDKHNVVDNGFGQANYGQYPDFLTRLEQVNENYSTFSITDWGPLGLPGTANSPVFSDAIDVNLGFEAGNYGGYAAADQLSADTAATYPSEEGPDAAFVYFGYPDIAGHNFGAGPDVPQYLAAIEQADAQVGQLLEAIQTRPDTEDWLVMVTTDHGHRVPGGGHGGNSLLERTTFVIAAGGDVVESDVVEGDVHPEATLEMVDPAVSALSHMGVELDPA